jgi:hypothetical protein
MQENCGVVGDPMNRVLAWLVFGGYLSVALTQRSLPATLVVGVGWFVLLLPAILTGWVWLML